MVRVIKPEEYAAKRSEILDAALRLIYTRGYERMTIQDLLSDLGMSNGAFYHYFASKPAVLEALIQRIQQGAEQPLLPIVNDPQAAALEKFQRYLMVLNQASFAHKTFIAGMLRVWLSDENALVREKVYAAMAERRAPLLAQIIRQGIQEGVFTTAYPDQAAQIFHVLARGIGDALVRLMLMLDDGRDEQGVNEEIVTTYAAYADTLERILGAPAGSLHRFEVEEVQVLVTTLRNG